jgi:hypothetical protein
METHCFKRLDRNLFLYIVYVREYESTSEALCEMCFT